MIRVNLNRSRVITGADEATAVATMPVLTDATNPRDMAIKIACILIGTIGLWVFEKQNIDALTAQASTLTGQLNKIRQEVTQKSGQLDQLKDIIPQAQALGDKLKILREFSKLRLDNLQSLDFLQSVIPERVWLLSINYDAKRYRIVGNSMDTVDLTDFVNKLEGSAYFQDVIVIQDTEKAIQGGKIREFEMTARAGAKE